MDFPAQTDATCRYCNYGNWWLSKTAKSLQGKDISEMGLDRGTASKFAALLQRSRVLSLYRFSVALCPVAPSTIYCTEPVNLKTGAQDRTGYMK